MLIRLFLAAFLVVCVTALSSCTHNVSPLPQLKGVEISVSPALLNFEKTPYLEAYLQDVLLHNQQIEALVKTAEAAALSPDIISADGKLHIDGTLSAERRNHVEDTLLRANTFAAGLQVKWSPDLWAKLTDEENAAKKLSEKEFLEVERFKQQIVAQALQTWFSHWLLNRQEEILAERLVISRISMDSLEQCYRSGGCSYSEYDASKIQTLSIQYEADEVVYERRNTLNRLNVLRGQSPLNELSFGKEDAGLVIVDIPNSISVVSLKNRPDIVAAFKGAEALDYQTRAAYKALLPNISLTGALLKSSGVAADFLGKPLLWQLVGDVTQPLLNGNALKLQAEQKSKEAEASLAQYKDVVLKALADVEGALAQEKAYSQQLIKQKRILETTRRMLSSFEEQYQANIIDLKEYLQAKDTLLDEQLKWANAQYKLASNRVELALALGIPMSGGGR